MKQLFNKNFFRAVSVAFAGALTLSSVAMFAGCNTAHPKVKITVEFQSEEYELDYKLYRKMYPATVQHFVELADNGYYDGLCIHNYDTKTMYAGVYNYNADDENNGMGGLEYKDYYNTVKSYKKFTQSVFDLETGLGTYTVYGEFANNGFSVENNALTHKYGSLVMYYNDISFCEEKVQVQLSSSKDKATKHYQYNSATSEFYIFTGTTNSSANKKYCVFGEIIDAEDLEELVDAIDEYIDAQDDDYEFVTQYDKVIVDTDDAYADKHFASYKVPKEPIVIKKVKVVNF